jgi:hypothetical protein
LDLDRATYRVDASIEYGQQTVTHGPNDAAFMLKDLRVYEIQAERPESRQRTLFVDTHQAGIADRVGAQDDGRPALSPRV